jgi:hypothetical protein
MLTSIHNKAFNEQKKFAFYCRTGNYKRLSGTTPNRIKHYRNLVWNVIEDSLQTAFPLSYKLLGINEWNKLVQDFFSNHNCKAFQVWKMPVEFYAYFSSKDLSLKNKYPFLQNLLLFEWKEIEIFMLEDTLVEKFHSRGNVLIDDLILNPDYELLQLDYPVHIKRAGDITTEDKGNYFLLIFRNPENFEVQFIDIGIPHVWLIEHIIQEKKSVYHLTKQASETFQTNEKDLLQHFETFLKQMQEQKFILGFKN